MDVFPLFCCLPFEAYYRLFGYDKLYINKNQSFQCFSVKADKIDNFTIIDRN